MKRYLEYRAAADYRCVSYCKVVWSIGQRQTIGVSVTVKLCGV
jgi:hypothetical protein